MRINVGVIFGGKSVEHEISIISACEIMGYFDSNKYNVVPIYIDKDNNWYGGKHLKDIINYRDIDLVKRYAKRVALIRKDKRIVLQKVNGFKKDLEVIDVILPIGHGTYMEDGSLQGYLDMLGVPYIGSKVSASNIGFDKYLTKVLLEKEKIPTAKYVAFTEKDYSTKKEEILNNIKSLGYPVYVKPSMCGSSIGITLVEDDKKLSSAIKEAFKFSPRVLVEEQIKNLKEVNISIVGTAEKYELSDIEELNTDQEFYSFKDKYVGEFKKTIKKEDKKKKVLSKELNDLVKEYASKTFKLIDASGIIRIDFLIDEKNNKVYVGEVNTIPGSLSSYLWLPKKVNQTELLDNLVKIAIYEWDKKQKLTYSFCSNLLERFDNLKGEKLNKK